MTPERWQQIKTVLCNALEVDDEEDRRTYLRTACGQDAELRREVHSLLECAGDDLELFADNLRSTMSQRVLRDPVGQRLGAYRIVSEIGRGGMGSVYLAERADGQFEKQVAIKLLKRGTDTDEILKRFKSERQILARLEHPNIARLIDAGTTDDSLPYFIMEYVTGAPVTEFVRDQHLSLRDRLELFLKICAAVEFAHQNAVVHRDLKPSNILVGGNGEPKLLDFGIAKLTASDEDGDEVTTLQQRRLTASYASPEQAGGRPVTFRTDVYALGAVLYEILTDNKPHTFAHPNPSVEEIRRVLDQQEPRPPSEVASEPDLQRQLKSDLDVITLQAMRRNPDLRYHSVNELADDVRRVLNGTVPIARAKQGVFRWLAVAAIIVLTAIGFFTYRTIQSGRTDDTATSSIPAKSVAVLPFQNRGPEPDSAFAAGVQEEILYELAKVADLKVISHASVMQFEPAQPRDLKRIGQSLGVAHVLEGSVQQAGNHVRVAAQLIDTRSGSQIWASHYDRELSDIFALESELAQTITAQLKATISAGEKAEIEDRPTRDMVAYDLYLRGRRIVDSYLDLPDPRTSLLEAVDLLERATARDPNFALAFSCTARAHDLLYFLELDLNSDRVQQAERAAKTAVQLRPESGEAHLAMADHYFRCYRDYERARQELAISGPKLPNSVPFFLLNGYIDRRQGLWNEATRSFSKAVELDPANLNAINLLADHYVLLRRFGEATQTYQRAIAAGLDSPLLRIRMAWAGFGGNGDVSPMEQALQSAPADLDVAGGATPWRIMVALVHHQYDRAVKTLADSPRPDFQNVDYSFYYPRAWYEGVIARARGDRESARAAFGRARTTLVERLAERPVDPRTLGVLSEVDAAIGDKELAIREGKQAIERMPISRDAYDGALVLQNLAQTYVWTGENRLAFDLVNDLLTRPGYVSYGFLKVDPAWDPLRDDPRFSSLLLKAKAGQSTLPGQ